MGDSQQVKHPVIIYESSSFGGCYKYAIELYKAYSVFPGIQDVKMLLPANANDSGSGIYKVLLRDDQPGNKLLFLRRQFINPLKLFSFLRKMPASFVLLNDFEQISSPLWGPLYRLYLKKHIFGVFLHDANRDGYPPSPTVSAFCMKQIMKTVKLALHHGQLPEKSYYYKRNDLTYLSVHHGMYSLPEPDKNLATELKEKTAGFSCVLSIPGNIRMEKNYQIVIPVLAHLPGFCLIIAGNFSNSSVDTNSLKKLAVTSGVDKQVIWVEKYLSEPELSAVINASDLIILYYAKTFHAQSGILHQVVSLKKPVLVSDLPNPLADTVKTFGLGYVCKADDSIALQSALSNSIKEPLKPDWDGYFQEISWSRQIEKVLLEIQKIDHILFQHSSDHRQSI